MAQMMAAAQMALPGFEARLADKRSQAVGALGECAAKRLLEKAGYEVRQGWHCGWDLRVMDRDTGQIVYLEVKTARQGKDGKWRFTLVKDGRTDHRRSDRVVLLAALDSGRIIPFLLPTAVIEARRHIVITSHPERYAGRFAAYRVANFDGFMQ